MNLHLGLVILFKIIAPREGLIRGKVFANKLCVNFSPVKIPMWITVLYSVLIVEGLERTAAVSETH